MSWLSGYKKKDHPDPREEARKKLEAERLERQKRVQKRAENQRQLQEAIKARQEASEALEALHDIDPTIFEGEGSDETVNSDILDEIEDTERVMAPAVPPVKYDTANENDDADVYKKLGTLKTEFNKDDPKFWFANFERTIKHFGVKSQITKKEALI